ncbi:MAG: PDDEXK nuclease domain-containing protein [bacterium]|nr:PDDEXK nuclease domain-containing protein [bacterium]
MKNVFDQEYKNWLREIKEKIKGAQIRAALSANCELISLYWFLGSQIVEKQKTADWGSGFIDQFSKDLIISFPDLAGFSSKNLRYCRAFYNFYTNPVIWQQIVAKLSKDGDHEKWQQLVAGNDAFSPDNFIPKITGQIPWGHNIHVFTKSKSFNEALFYINQTIENGWGRDVLALQIKSNLFKRSGKAVTNFKNTLPEPMSDLAQQTIKDPYRFNFMTMTRPYIERDIENQLTDNISKFLLELGKGFAFVGRQYHLEVGESDYYIDLLFYHIKLKCYVVIELKNTKFIPEYAGKLNFYLSAVDSYVKEQNDNPTIGILLCRDKNNIEAEFSLRDIGKPMGVSEFEILEKLPQNLRSSLPTIEEIEAGLQKEFVKTNKTK